MRRSKLELYVSVLNSVLIHGPINITALSLRARLNYVQLKPIILNLVKKGAAQEQITQNGSIFYTATPLGYRLSTQFKQTENLQPPIGYQPQKEIIALFTT